VGDEEDEKEWEEIKRKKNLNLRKEFQSQAARDAENERRQKSTGRLKTLAQRIRGDRV
jgi:hypothetical protein